MALYFAVLTEFGTWPSTSLPLSILIVQGSAWAPSFPSLCPFLLPCKGSVACYEDTGCILRLSLLVACLAACCDMSIGDV